MGIVTTKISNVELQDFCFGNGTFLSACIKLVNLVIIERIIWLTGALGLNCFVVCAAESTELQTDSGFSVVLGAHPLFVLLQPININGTKWNIQLAFGEFHEGVVGTFVDEAISTFVVCCKFFNKFFVECSNGFQLKLMLSLLSRVVVVYSFFSALSSKTRFCISANLSLMIFWIISLFGQFGLILFFLLSQNLGWIETPKLLYCRFPFLETCNISGFSPFFKVLDL